MIKRLSYGILPQESDLSEDRFPFYYELKGKDSEIACLVGIWPHVSHRNAISRSEFYERVLCPLVSDASEGALELASVFLQALEIEWI